MPAATKRQRSTSRELDASTLAARYLRRKSAGKKGYKDSDVTMDALEAKLNPGDVVVLDSGNLAGKKFRFVDTWAGKSRVNAGMNVRRFDLEPVTDP